MPLQVPLSAEAWADHLCRALPPDFLDRERQALPAVADAPAPC